MSSEEAERPLEVASKTHQRVAWLFGSFRAEPTEGRLLQDGQLVALTPKAFEALTFLLERRGHLVTRDELIAHLWPENFVDEANLTSTIWMIRRALGEGDAWVETVPKRGYRFSGVVEEIPLGLEREETPTRAPDSSAVQVPIAASWAGSWLPTKRWLFFAVAIALTALAAGWTLSRRKGPPPPAPNARFSRLTDQAGRETTPSLSPDGTWFVYAADTAGNWDIHWQRVGGQTAVNLTRDSAADDTQPAISFDGRQIAFRSERDGGGLYVMGATGESVRRVSDFGFSPSWSPDGTEILCVDERVVDFVSRVGSSRLWVISAATGARRQVLASDAVQPQWSPHGHRIAYWGNVRPKGFRDIQTVAASGGEPVAVTSDSFVDVNPVWSPDGRYLHFASERGGSMNLWRVAIDERSGRVLSSPEPMTVPSAYSGYLSLSRSGQYLAYTQEDRLANLQTVAFDPVAEAVVGELRWITRGTRSATEPQISPDGNSVVFGSVFEPQEDLFVIRRDGSGLRQLTNDPAVDRHPRWSPDGRRIVFSSPQREGSRVWSIKPDGSELRPLVGAPFGGFMLWSPDSTRLASVVQRAPVIVDVDANLQMVGSRTLPRLPESVAMVTFWSWSADGFKLAGHEFRDEKPLGIVLYALDTHQYERLTDFGARPVWLSDNRRLLFDDGYKLYLVDSHSKRVREVLSIDPDRVERFSLSRDDRHLVIQRTSRESDIWLFTLPPAQGAESQPASRK
jgi:eukaryotic-like serine/threonine-protein kinase